MEKDQADLISTSIAVDSNASVVLTSYHPEKLEYTYNSAIESNVAFSEIYYAQGWHAYIDKQEVDHFRESRDTNHQATATHTLGTCNALRIVLIRSPVSRRRVPPARVTLRREP